MGYPEVKSYGFSQFLGSDLRSFLYHPSNPEESRRCADCYQPRNWRTGRYIHVCQVVSFSLNLYATNDVIAKAALEFKSFEKFSKQKPGQYDKALKDKVPRLGESFSKQRAKSILVQKSTLTVRDIMRMY